MEGIAIDQTLENLSGSIACFDYQAKMLLTLNFPGGRGNNWSEAHKEARKCINFDSIQVAHVDAGIPSAFVCRARCKGRLVARMFTR